MANVFADFLPVGMMMSLVLAIVAGGAHRAVDDRWQPLCYFVGVLLLAAGEFFATPRTIVAFEHGTDILGLWTLPHTVHVWNIVPAAFAAGTFVLGVWAWAARGWQPLVAAVVGASPLYGLFARAAPGPNGLVEVLALATPVVLAAPPLAKRWIESGEPDA